MKIHTAKIQNFRSIKNETVEFSPNVNVFIGKNNAGKTNVAKAILLFFGTTKTNEVQESALDEGVTEDDWYLQKTNVPIQLNFRLMLNKRETDRMLKILRLTRRRISKVSTRKIKHLGEGMRLAVDALNAKDGDGPTMTVTREFRFRSDSSVTSGVIFAAIEHHRIYDVETSMVKTKAFSHDTPSGGRSYKSIKNPVRAVVDEISSMLVDKCRFMSPAKAGLRKQERNRGGKDVSNMLYNMQTGRTMPAKYRVLKRQIESLPFADGEFRPSVYNTHRGTFAELMIDMAEDLSLPVGHFGEGLQSSVNMLYDIVFHRGDVLVIEEPENSLHPAGQRDIFEKLKDLSRKYSKQIMITSHSSVFIDRSGDARLFRISCPTDTTKIDQVEGPESVISILDDLGFRPSDALLSNGVIWVEGPSDRSYVRKWLRLFGLDTDDYGVTILPYGGSNLRHLTVDDFRTLNHHFVVIMDGDRRSGALTREFTGKLEFKKEIEKTGNQAWVTKKYAIDNYVPARVIEEKYGLKDFRVDSFQSLSGQIRKAASGQHIECSYRKVRDSPKLAELMTREDIEQDKELNQQITRIMNAVKGWSRGLRAPSSR